MLDENTYVPKPRVAVLEVQTFITTDPSGGYLLNYDLCRKLTYGQNANWLLAIVYRPEDIKLSASVFECLNRFNVGIFYFEGVETTEKFDRIAKIADFGYTPTLLKTLPVNFLLRQPSTPEDAIAVICYFAHSLEPFTPDNYYQFLSLL